MTGFYQICVTWEVQSRFGTDYRYLRFGVHDLNTGLAHALTLRPAGAETWIEVLEL